MLLEVRRYVACLVILTFITTILLATLSLRDEGKTLQSWKLYSESYFSHIETGLGPEFLASNLTNSSAGAVNSSSSESLGMINQGKSPTSKNVATGEVIKSASSLESSVTAIVTNQMTARTVKFKISNAKVNRVINKIMEPQGHIFVYSSFEEQTNGARNLWQLEMWAKLLNMKVAEPFAINSMFGISGVAPNFDQALRFSDYFDIQEWNKSVLKYGGSPLVRWEEFLSTAPLNAVILCTVMRQSDGPPYVVTYNNIDDIQKYDPGKYEQITSNDMHWIEENFNITRVVTLIRNVKTKHPLTLKDFNSYVFGNLKPTNVTLIVVNWIGIGVQESRIEINGGTPASFLAATRIGFGGKGTHTTPVIAPSQRIMEAFKAYKAEFIGDRKYIGVLFRAQAVMYFTSGEFNFKSKILLDCSESLRHELDKIRKKWAIFLAYDLGRFGSVGYFDSIHDQRLFPLHKKILLDVFNGTVLSDQRDSMLIKAASGITDSGFIALLEKTIAVHANCIILLGKFSSFIQSSALQYISLHDTNRCIVSICSEQFRDSKGKVTSISAIPDRILHD